MPDDTKHTGLSDLPPEVVAQLLEELDPDQVKTRPKGGTQVPFIPGEEAINTANAVFGFGAWGVRVIAPPELREVHALDPETGERRYLGCFWWAVVETQVAGCQPQQGYGVTVPRSATTFESHVEAAKGCVTDATKRALVHLGSRFGLSLRDGDTRREILRETQQRGERQPTASRRKRPASRDADPRARLRRKVLDLGREHWGWDEAATRSKVAEKLGKPWDRATDKELAQVATDMAAAGKNGKAGAQEPGRSRPVRKKKAA